MKSAIVKSFTVSLAVIAAIALPAAVKAESESLSETTPTTSGEQLTTEMSEYCFRIPGYGIICW